MKTYNELVVAMAKRAGELASLSMDSLRATYPEGTDTRSELIRFCKESKLTKEIMINDILLEEFLEEFDKEFA